MRYLAKFSVLFLFSVMVFSPAMAQDVDYFQKTVSDGVDFEDNSEHRWRFNLFGSPSQDLVAKSGSQGSFVVEVFNDGNSSLDVGFEVVGNSSVSGTVELSREVVSIPSKSRKSVRVDYRVPEGFDGSYDFVLRAYDDTWNRSKVDRGAEYVVFKSSYSDEGLFLKRFSRINDDVEVDGGSFPFLLIPLIPSVLMFLLLVGIGGFEGEVVFISAFFSMIAFILFLLILPAF